MWNGGGIHPLTSANRTGCLINSETVALGKQSGDAFGTGDGSSYVTTLNTASFSDKFSDVITLTNAPEGRVIYTCMDIVSKHVSCQQIVICLPSDDMKVLSREIL